jgi:hypothetical protein
MEPNNPLTVLDPHGQPSGVFGRRLDAKSRQGILDPLTQPSSEPEPMSLTPRLTDLDGKTVYLVDTGFGGSEDFLLELQDWFARNLPGVNTEFRRKQGSMFTDDAELWEEMSAAGADAAILGVGG